MERPYQVCNRCVMDTSDPEIVFDEKGICNHCRDFQSFGPKIWHQGEDGLELLNGIIEKIKSDGKGKEYDCILGLSGGADSSYLALKVKEWGLRPLVVHIDAGWNSELAVANIEKILKYCNYDLHTRVMNWEEMRDLQLSYLKAAVSNQDVPQDHAFFASLYHFAIENGIKTILSGGNYATEGIFPRSWLGSAMDAKNLHAIQRKYGTIPLKDYKTISFFKYYVEYPLLYGMRTIRPLNYINYNKQEAIAFLEKTIGWKSYERKHGESFFTKFYQNFYLPTKFGFDKRRPHFSSMIMSNQLEREEAMRLLDEPLYDANELESDITYFCKKMRISREEFDVYMHAEKHNYNEYSNWDRNVKFIKTMQLWYAKIFHKYVNVYS